MNGRSGIRQNSAANTPVAGREGNMRIRAFCVGVLALVLGWLPHLGQSDPPAPDEPPVGEKIATFSIAAVDPEAGVCGAAVASKYPAAGKVVAHARADVGAVCTHHYGLTAW